MSKVYIGDTPEQLDCGIMINGQLWSGSRIAELQQRNAELAAQVEQLLKAFDEFHGIAASCDGWETFPQKALDDACDAMMAKPAQCLTEHDREVAARAVEAAIKYNDACNSGMDYGSSHGGFYVHEFLEKIKSGEVQL